MRTDSDGTNWSEGLCAYQYAIILRCQCLRVIWDGNRFWAAENEVCQPKNYGDATTKNQRGWILRDSG